jgi:hypothetical protein
MTFWLDKHFRPINIIIISYSFWTKSRSDIWKISNLYIGEYIPIYSHRQLRERCSLRNLHQSQSLNFEDNQGHINLFSLLMYHSTDLFIVAWSWKYFFILDLIWICDTLSKTFFIQDVYSNFLWIFLVLFW